MESSRSNATSEAGAGFSAYGDASRATSASSRNSSGSLDSAVRKARFRSAGTAVSASQRAVSTGSWNSSSSMW